MIQQRTGRVPWECAEPTAHEYVSVGVRVAHASFRGKDTLQVRARSVQRAVISAERPRMLDRASRQVPSPTKGPFYRSQRTRKIKRSSPNANP
jgi:hypothetical protein